MASRFLDLILPDEELYVPSNRDHFSIVPGGMPNGDPSLRIAGGVANAAYTARVPTVSGVHFTNFTSTAVVDGQFHVSFWIKAHPSVGFVTSGLSTGIVNGRVLFTAMRHDAVYTNASTGIDSNDRPLVTWVIGATSDAGGTTYRLAFYEMNQANGGTTSTPRAFVDVDPGVWTFVAFQRIAGAAGGNNRRSIRAYKNGLQTGSFVDMSINAGVNAATAGGSHYFCIGVPETTSIPCMNLASGDTSGFEIGKVALLNSFFTSEQLVNLYDAMLNGPPS
jgi:hypothetical protein